MRGYQPALSVLVEEVRKRSTGRVACLWLGGDEIVGDPVPGPIVASARRHAWDAARVADEAWCCVSVIAPLPGGEPYPVAILFAEACEAGDELGELAALVGPTLLLAVDGAASDREISSPAAFRRLARRWGEVAAKRHNEVAMLAIAVDGLADVNAGSGFDAGDAAIDEVFRWIVREQPATAHSALGGATIGILLANTSAAEAEGCATRLLARFSEVRVPSAVTLSIGVAALPVPDDDLVRAARTALLAARQQRRSVVRWEPALVVVETDDPLQDFDSVSDTDYQRILTLWRLFEVLTRGPQLDQLIANTLRVLLPLFRADRVALWRQTEGVWARRTTIDRATEPREEITPTQLIEQAARTTEVVRSGDRVIAIGLRRGSEIAGVIEIARFTAALRVDGGELEFLVTCAGRIGRVIGEVEALSEARRRQQATADRLRQQTLELRRLVRTSSGLLGNDKSMQPVFRMVERSRTSSYPVVISGETGTGKEAVARLVHRMSGRRGPFVVVDCGALPAGLLESELFGHEKGAFTGADSRKIGRFEEAHMGTIFLDEIGELPLELQPKLLRVLQEQCVRRLGGREVISVDFRLIAATHRDLETMVAEERFRQDLYFRLRVLEIGLPPLRDRGDDIMLLALHSLRQYCAEMGREMMTIAPDAEDLMRAYPWPGNVRELQNVLRRAVVIAQGNELTMRDLDLEIARKRSIPTPIEGVPVLASGLEETVAAWFWQAWVAEQDAPPQDAIEAFLLRTAIQLSSGSVGKAAQLLDMHSETFISHLDKLGDPHVSRTIRHHALAGLLEKELEEPASGELRDRILRVLLTELLVYCRGNKSEMARHLAWGRQTLARQLKRLDVVAGPSTVAVR